YFGADSDPTFDSNDELCFMAKDMGDQVTNDVWIDDATSQTYQRYEIQVVDATNSAKRSWAYVYRSNTVNQTFTTDYAGFATTSGRDSLYAQGYTLGYNGAGILVNTRVTAAGGGDNVEFLDRSKLRVTAK